jgi:hypothetical protein
MQDDSHINTNPRDAGGKWKRQTTSAAETAKTALEAGSVSVKQGARDWSRTNRRGGPRGTRSRARNRTEYASGRRLHSRCGNEIGGDCRFPS